MIKLKHGENHELNISIGKSRFETKWKNIKKTWPELIEKLQSTHRTHETHTEYMKMGKANQDTIKDVGAFVGGHLKDGKRRKGHVVSRSIISLDADFAYKDMWDDVELAVDYAILAYSTHKHAPNKPRLRFLIPLQRDVSPEEYEAVARKLANDFGMDYFDDTTYQPERLMYWPSTSKDADYFFKYLDLPILNPDDILATYPDWKDTSYWPESSRSTGIRKKQADKQGDPLAKPGLIGAFCRTYTIDEAIDKFLKDVYSPGATVGRYTYTKGSTAGGLVVYEDKFAYSNHSTDPTGGMLCNAFDLVRIHKFGELDKDAKEDTPVNKLPSWNKMVDLINGDEATKITIGRDHIEGAALDFNDTEAVDDDDLNWMARLTTKSNGQYEVTIENLVLIMQKDPNLKGLVRQNIFNARLEVIKNDLPWQRRGPYWTDTDDAGLRWYYEKVYNLEGRQKLIDALAIVAEENAYHPVKDYLEDLIWDGTPRVETVLIDYLGADDNEYTRTVTRKTLVAAIKRIYEPGCKFDYILTITGKQGIGKSLLIKKLGGEWFSDTLVDIRGKEAYEALDGVWLMEMGELAALKRSEREAIKNYVSKQEDTYRKAYNRNTTINKRQCVFIGTTNDTEFLNDSTGSRRFWVVDTDPKKRTKTVWHDLTADERDQIWAEAVELYHKGENIMYLPEEIQKVAAAVQEAFSQESQYQATVDEYLERPVPNDWYSMSLMEQRAWYNATEDFKKSDEWDKYGKYGLLVERTKVCPQEIWFVALKEDKLPIPSPYIAKELRDCIVKNEGWEKDKSPGYYGGYGRQRGCHK